MAGDIYPSFGLLTTTSTSGTTAPASGTSETWSVAALGGVWPTLTGGNTIVIQDTAIESEIIRVTAMTAGGTSITVTRGADNTTPVAHATGATFQDQAVAFGNPYSGGGSSTSVFFPVMPAPSGDLTGVTDSAALAACQALLGPTGAGDIIWRQGVYYLVANSGQLPCDQHWWGQGKNATCLTLANNQNNDFITTANWTTLKNTQPTPITVNNLIMTADTNVVTVASGGFASITVGMQVQISPDTQRETVVTSVTPGGTYDTITLSKPVNYTQTAGQNISGLFFDVPARFGLHYLTLDGNAGYNSANVLARPVISSAVAHGTTGFAQWCYMVSAVNAIGESIASQEAIITNGNVTLTGTNYNTITWSAVAGATSYNIYRSSGSLWEYFLVNTSSTTYNDNGTVLYTSGNQFPVINTSGGRVLATMGFGWTIEYVNIQNGASCGWDSQSSSLGLNFDFAEDTNHHANEITFNGNYGGACRFYGPTDGFARVWSFNGNGNDFAHTGTNGQAELDMQASGLSLDGGHMASGLTQYGMRLGGIFSAISGVQFEDSLQYHIMLYGSDNTVHDCALYSTGGNVINDLGFLTVALTSGVAVTSLTIEGTGAPYSIPAGSSLKITNGSNTQTFTTTTTTPISSSGGTAVAVSGAPLANFSYPVTTTQVGFTYVTTTGVINWGDRNKVDVGFDNLGCFITTGNQSAPQGCSITGRGSYNEITGMDMPTPLVSSIVTGTWDPTTKLNLQVKDGNNSGYVIINTNLPGTGEMLANGGEVTYPRVATNSTIALSTGVAFFNYFTAANFEVIGHVATQSMATAASGLTYAAVGIYSVDPSGNLTFITSTGDLHASMWTSTYSTYNEALTATFLKIPGQRYAIGLLAVGTTPPSLNGGAFGSWQTQQPFISSTLSGQSTLPTGTIAYSSVTGYAQCVSALVQP